MSTSSMKACWKRILSFMLVLAMLIGFVPAISIGPVHAADSTMHHRLTTGFIINRQVSFTNKFTGVSGRMASVNNHTLDNLDAFCIDPTIKAGDDENYHGTYTNTGSARSSTTTYYTQIPESARYVIAGIVKYHHDHPQADDTTGGYLGDGWMSRAANVNGGATWVAKCGAQLAIFDAVVSEGPGHIWSQVDDYRQQMYGDINTYAQHAYAWAVEEANKPGVSVKEPNFNGNGKDYRLKLTYNAASGKYEGSVTDSNGALASEGYNLNKSESGLVVSQSGNTISVSATLEAMDALGLYSSSNAWLTTDTVSKTGTQSICLDQMIIYSCGDEYQNMIFYDPTVTVQPETAQGTATIRVYGEPAIGQAQVKKASSDTTISGGNGCYSLAGAVYKIYASQADANANRNAEATLTTDANGNTPAVDIVMGTHYLKEVTAAPGFALDPEVHAFTVTAGQTATVNVSDVPKSDPVSVVLRKVDSQTNSATPSGTKPLSDAEYTVRFYAGQYSTASAAESSGTLKRTWVIKTNANGFATLSDAFKVSGDAFYVHDGQITFPLGTVVIFESKAPAGYLIDNTKYVMNITEGGGTSWLVETYNEPISKEVPVMAGLKIAKKDAANTSAQGNATLSGAEFTVYNRSGVAVFVNGNSYANNAAVMTLTIPNGANSVSTGSNVFPCGTYEVKETKASAGYLKNESWSYTFTVSDDGTTNDNGVVFDAGTCPETIIAGGIAVQKYDAATGATTPQGDGSFENIVFTIKNSSTAAILYNGTSIAPGSVVTTIKTNAAGKASTGANALPYGKYTVTETSVPASTGYNRNSGWSAVVTVSENGTIYTVSPNATNVVMMGTVNIQKVDALTGKTTPEGDAQNLTTKIDIINLSSKAVVVNGASHAPNTVVMTITTNASGYGTSGKVLPYGKYKAVENTPPTGYLKNTSWSQEFTITSDGQVVDLTDDAHKLKETPIRGGIKVQKYDKDTGGTTPQGDGSFTGIEFSIVNASGHSVVVGGQEFAVGAEVAVITTNASGVAQTADKYLPYGTYTVTEKSVPAGSGYTLNQSWSATVSVRSDGQIYTVSPVVKNDVYRGTVNVQKADALTGRNEPEGDAANLVTKIDIINKSDKAVTINGTSYAPDAVVYTITTDANGSGTSGKILPFGRYQLVEKTPPTGYLKNTSWTKDITITTDGQVVDLTGPSHKLKNTPIRGGIQVQKYDNDTGNTTPQGDGSFAGIEFSIVNASGHSVVVGGQEYAVGAEVAVITTDASGVAKTADKYLPYGTYTVTEKSVPDNSGYLLNTNWSATVVVRANGQMYVVSPDAKDAVMRGSIRVQKYDKDTSTKNPQGDGSFAGIEFSIVNASSHPVVVGGQEYAVGAEVAVITTDATGLAKTAAKYLPYGTYTITEKSVPADSGYILNTDWSATVEVRDDGQTYTVSPVVKDDVIRGGISVQKYDKDTSTKNPQGDGSFAGIEFSIVNASSHPVVVGGTTYAVGQEVAVIVTDNAGLAKTAANALPYGTYTVTEKTVPTTTGYKINSAWSVTVQVRENGKMYAVSPLVKDDVFRGAISIQKFDADWKTANAQGDATLQGAEIQIINSSNRAVVVNGTTYAKNAVVYTLVTDANGKASTPDNYLPYGTYTLKEVKAPTGYNLNSDWSYSAVIRTDGQKINVTSASTSVRDNVIRGIISVQKRDAETNSKTPLGGAKFEGCEITLINRSAKSIYYEGNTYAPGDVVDVLVVGSNGKATSKPLPYGTYELKETKAPAGYYMNETWTKTVNVRTQDHTYLLDNDNAIVEQIIRNDLMFQKVHGITMERMANIPFRVTSKTTGESHIIVTDVNGIFDSSAFDHETNTNKNDEAVNGDTVDESKLDPTYGVWFSGRREQTPARNSYHAFPYDTYVFEELRVTANSKTDLVTFEITVYRDIPMLDIGTVDDNGPTKPYIITKLLDQDTQDHVAAAAENIHLIDEVTFSGLQVNVEYVLDGKLLDVETGSVIATASKNFTPSSPYGVCNVPFDIDASDLAGKTVVALQTLSLDGEELYVHDNVNDEAEMVYFPKIHTTAQGVNGEKIVSASKETIIIDTITFENLVPDLTYIVKGSLIDKSTGEVLRDSSNHPVTAEVTFKPETSDGTVDMEFKFDASKLDGLNVVAFEELTRNSVIVAEHKDINDAGQTVAIPNIHTTLTGPNDSHTALATANMTLTDTIEYFGLIPGQTYTAVGTLMDQETGEPVIGSNGPITAEKTFVPTASDGSVTVTFTFNGLEIAGTAVVAFEEVSNGFYVCAEHKDLEDESQTVYIPAIRTTATDKNNHKEIFANGKVTIADVVEYEQLVKGQYELEGVLYNKATGNPITIDGSEITASRTFTVRDSSGSVTLNFVIDDASVLEGISAVVYETLKDAEGNIVAEHKDIDDVDQTVSFPKIRTQAHSDDNDSEFIADEITVIDTIRYENLIPGESYTAEGRLVDKSTGKVVRDASGNEVTASADFTADDVNGTVDVTFVFDASTLGGKTLVAFEDLYNAEGLVAKHADLEDEEQTVTIPSIETTLKSEDETHLVKSTENVSLTDTVTYTNLIPGREYTAVGTLMDKADGSIALDKEGEPITATQTFTPDEPNGSVELTFIFNGIELAGHDLVAFEQVSNEFGVIAVHEDIEDEDQTVSLPAIRTSAADKSGNKEFYANGNIELIDTVSYENLIPGLSYTLNGKLVDKATGDVIIDNNGNEVTSTATFKPRDTHGETTLSFRFNAGNLEGKTLVVFESLSYEGVEIAVHEDIEDAAQTITFPKIRTSAGNDQGGKEFLASDEVYIYDTVTYENLIPGNRYTVYGKLVDKTSGKLFRDADGVDIAASEEFTADENGTVTVTFHFNASLMAGKTAVVFEELRDEYDRVVGKHADLTDEDQTVTFPKISTMIFGEDNKQVVMAKDGTLVTDYITFENLVEGHTYIISGVLMDKATGSVALDAEGNEIVAEARFTASASSGVASIDFVFDASQLGGHVLVAFETISDAYGPIAEHKDIDDEEQTIYVPYLGTSAADKNGNKEFFANGKSIILDTVTYTDLQVGQTYTISGILMDRATGEPVLDADGNEITAAKTFRATSADGSQTLKFEFNDSVVMEGKTLVVFETLYHDDTTVAVHADIEDEAQTITYPKIRTSAASAQGGKEFLASEELELIDTVAYENLVPGASYKMTATVVDKATGRVVRDANGDEVTATVDFTADENGTVEVPIVFNASKMAGKTLVCYEVLRDSNDRIVGEHKDIDDAEQTITIPKIATTIYGEDNERIILAQDGALVTDSITFENLVVGHTYTISGVLMDKETEDVALDSNGDPIVAEKTFVAESENGVVTIDFVFDASLIDGHTFVAFETISDEYGPIAEHKDIDDQDQTMYIPHIATSAADKNGYTEFFANGSVSIIDTVSFTNLQIGKTYRITGILMDKETGEPVLDANGNEITAEKTFRASAADGTQLVKFEFRDAVVMEGKTLVVFETMYNGDTVIAKHEDLEDEAQTVTFPKIRTLAQSEVGTKEFLAGEQLYMIDTVSYENLVPGSNYTLYATLMDKATGKVVRDANGDEVTSQITFTPSDANDTVDVTFSFDASDMAGKTLVCYEVLKDADERIVGEHKDLEDADQTITIPKIATTLFSDQEVHVVYGGEEAKFIDYIMFENLVIGHTYKVHGVLIDKETGEPAVDASGHEIEADIQFTAQNVDGVVEVPFIFDGRFEDGKTMVAFEYIYDESDTLIAKHEEETDKAQTGYVPAIRTTASDKDGRTEIRANGTVRIIDVIQYNNLTPGYEYAISGVMMDKATGEPALDGNGNEIRASLDHFTPATSSGSISVTFVFDATGMDGMTIVAYETLTLDDVVVADHTDINDVDQTITFPAIGTTAHDGNDNHEFLAEGETTIVDTVRYENLVPGQEYTVIGTLMDKATHKAVKDAAGDVVTSETTFYAAGRDGTVDVTFTFDISHLENKTVVAYEDLYRYYEGESYLVVRHADLEDEDQTVTIPKIRTTFLSEADSHVVIADESVTLIDTVVFENLIVGQAYTFEGYLVDKETEEPVLDQNGEPITSSTIYTPEESNGSVELPFTFNSTDLAGHAVVAFETVSNDVKVVAKHADITDEDQTVYIPKIGTTAAGKDGQKEFFADGLATIVDTVRYESLKVGVPYIVSGKLMVKETGESLKDSDGNEIIVEREFVPKTSDGEIDIVFTIDADELDGLTLVAFETMYHADAIVAVHEDIEDEDQTVTLPKVWTTAHSADGDHEFLAAEDVEIIDTVHYENLIPGNNYVLYAELHDKADGKIATDVFGDEIRAFETFTPDEPDGDVDVVFHFNGVNMKNRTLVAYEDLYNGVEIVGRHADLEDEEQTVTFPEIGTTLNDENEQQVTLAGGEVTLIDTVYYENLVPGREYTVDGVLYDRETEEELTVLVENDEGEEEEIPVTASTTFTAQEASGSVEVRFVFDSSKLVGRTVVAYEYLSNEYCIVAIHEDISDEEQASYLPHIQTTASDPNGEKDVFAGPEVQINDIVEYTNLQVGQTYHVEGTLYVLNVHGDAYGRNSGMPLTDANGNPVTAELDFSPKTSDGSVTLTFYVDASDLAGISLVAFERMYLNDVLIAKHEDLFDEEQTVHIPHIQTEATDEFMAHVTNVSESTNIIDRVDYTNLIPGESYEMVGILYLKSTGKHMKDDNTDIIESRVQFIPDEADGYVEVPFTLDTSELAEDSVVVFEILYHNGREVANHKEMTDESQTVHFPSIATSASFKNGDKIAAFDELDEEITIVDTVTYVNLVPGLVYKMSGSLMNADDGAVLRNADGDEYIAEAEFVPEEPNGSMDLEFVVKTKDVSGKTVVVFENLMLDLNTIAVHADLEDIEQTVTVPHIHKVFKYDATSYEPVAGAVFRIQDNGLAEDPSALVPLLPTVNVTSGEDGYFYFNTLPGHEYSIKEVQAPEGYNIDESEYFVVVNEAGEIEGDLEIANVRGGTVVISKTDVITGQPVPGCEITVYKQIKTVNEEKTKQSKEEAAKKAGVSVDKYDGEFETIYDIELIQVFQQITDDYGRIYFYTDEAGTYVFKETKTCDGYYLNEDIYEFTVDANQIVDGDVHITNVPFGTVVLTKIDTAGKPLKGAEFAIYDEYDRFYGKGITDAKGRVYFVSPGPGRYYFVETKAPEGYQITSDRHYFTIAENYAITGSVSIVNSRTGNPPTDKTGDLNHIGLWVALAALMLIGCGAGCYYVFKRKKDDGIEEVVVSEAPAGDKPEQDNADLIDDGENNA